MGSGWEWVAKAPIRYVQIGIEVFFIERDNLRWRGVRFVHSRGGLTCE